MADRTASFMQKFQDIGSKISSGMCSKAASGMLGKEKLISQTDDERIVTEYREKLQRENA